MERKEEGSKRRKAEKKAVVGKKWKKLRKKVKKSQGERKGRNKDGGRN